MAIIGYDLLNLSMSREQDKRKARELLKNWSIKRATKDLVEVMNDREIFVKLNKATTTPTNYSEVKQFALACAEHLKKKSDIKFLKALPDGDDSEYVDLPKKTKKRLFDILTSYQDYWGKKAIENEEALNVNIGRKDILGKGRIAHLKDEIDEIESDLSKKDYPTGWECALACRKMYADGELPNNVQSVTDAYKWGAKHCTIKGEDIPRYSVLASAYDSSKHNRTKAGTAIDKFEEEYYNKVN